MSTAERIFPDVADRWSKQDRNRWRLAVNWLAFEHGLLEQTLGHKPTPAEHHEHALKVLAAIWEEDERWWAEREKWKAQRAAKVVPLRPDSVTPSQPDSGA
jgi:hypothetical protein